MKNLIVAIATASLLVAAPASARDRGYHGRDNYNEYRGHRGHHNGGKWVAPLIGGIVLGAILSKSNDRQVVEQPREVYVYREPTPQPVCWDNRNIDIYGNVYYTRECR